MKLRTARAPGDPDCPHADWLDVEAEGWEDPTEPLSLRVSCSRCDRHITVVVPDPSLLQWEDGY